MTDALVIGGGPAGLMAAEALLDAGRSVLLVDQKPSLGRKFLMAGKSGLNLTKVEPAPAFHAAYERSGGLNPALRACLDAFGPEEVRAFAKGLGQEVFVGSTGRLFPVVMKASPILRAWLARVQHKGLQVRTRWRWTGWDGDAVGFLAPDGPHQFEPRVTVLACGGASWQRLGSDAAWTAYGVPHVPFQPSNVGLRVNWSEHMRPHFGKPVKAVAWRAGEMVSRGEAVISETGFEGGGVYTLTPAARTGAALRLDLMPDVSLQTLKQRWPNASKAGVKKALLNALRLTPEKVALFNEFRPRAPVAWGDIPGMLKDLPLRYAGLRPLDEAISTAGGVPFDALTNTLMLRDRPGTFCAGEMLDWDAPTGGYLLTACFATGLWAGQHAARYVT